MSRYAHRCIRREIAEAKEREENISKNIERYILEQKEEQKRRKGEWNKQIEANRKTPEQIEEMKHTIAQMREEAKQKGIRI